MATEPRMMMTMAITIANTGRFMKKGAIYYSPQRHRDTEKNSRKTDRRRKEIPSSFLRSQRRQRPQREDAADVRGMRQFVRGPRKARWGTKDFIEVTGEAQRHGEEQETRKEGTENG